MLVTLPAMLLPFRSASAQSTTGYPPGYPGTTTGGATSGGTGTTGYPGTTSSGTTTGYPGTTSSGTTTNGTGTTTSGTTTGTPTPPAASIHVIWNPDETTSPAAQQAVTGGIVGGDCIIHISFPLPPNAESWDVVHPTITEAAGHYGPLDLTSSNMTGGWSALCGDPDPTQPNAPQMAYFDFGWPTKYMHNGAHTFTANVEYWTFDQASQQYNGPIDVSFQIGVDVENILITSTNVNTNYSGTPPQGAPGNSNTDNPFPIIWDPTSMGTVSLSASMKSGYVGNQQVTLLIYSIDGTLVKTLTKIVTVGGITTDSSSPPNTTLVVTPVPFTWDGSTDIPPAYTGGVTGAGKGIYLYQFQVATMGSFDDGDQDKSALLTITQAVSNSAAYDASSHLNSYLDSCVLTEGVVPLPLASAAHVSVYAPDLTEVAEPSTGPPSNIFGGPTLTGLEINPVGGFTLVQNQYGRFIWDVAPYQIPIPPPLQPNDYTRLFSAEDNNKGQNKGHLLRWAFQRRAQPNPPVIEAASTADTALSGTPHYFSGTNCRVVGHAKIGPGSCPETYLISAELIIVDSGSDVTVNQYAYDSTLPQQQRVDVAANFDSTHFGDEASIQIKLRVTDNLGNICQSLLTVPARNKAYVLNSHAQLYSPWCYLQNPALASEIGPMNYTVQASTSDDAATIASNLPQYTMFYISSHGNANWFGDCNSTGDPQLNCLYCTSTPTAALPNPHGPYVSDIVASKTPDQPPYNFVFIDGCSAGSDNLATQGFGLSNGNTSDRAFLGWPVIMWGILDYDWPRALFDSLGSGDTLEDAVAEANLRKGPALGGTATSDFPLIDVINPFNEFIQPSILGDPAMKLHGVYNGTGADQWYFKSIVN